MIDLPTRPIAPSLTLHGEQDGRRCHEKKLGMLNHYQAAAHVGVTAMTDGAVLLVWTGRLLLSCVAHYVNAGMECLPASHQQKGERANDPHFPA